MSRRIRVRGIITFGRSLIGADNEITRLLMLPETEWTLNKFVWPEGNTSEFTDSFLNSNVKL